MKEQSWIQGENSQVAEKKKAKWEGKDDLICAKRMMDYFSSLLSHRFKKIDVFNFLFSVQTFSAYISIGNIASLSGISCFFKK